MQYYATSSIRYAAYHIEQKLIYSSKHMNTYSTQLFILS